MLVNLTPNIEKIERRRQISIEHNFEFIPQNDPRANKQIGVYQCTFDFNFCSDEFIEKIGSYDEYNESKLKDGETLLQLYAKGEYSITSGVADSVDQIKEYFKKEIKDKKHKFCISITPVWQEKENKGKGGGWRWHKWGKYIGKLNPQYEYLDDEDFGDDFEYILCFHLHYIMD